jgi:copper chaperone CopZ
MSRATLLLLLLLLNSAAAFAALPVPAARATVAALHAVPADDAATTAPAAAATTAPAATAAAAAAAPPSARRVRVAPAAAAAVGALGWAALCARRSDVLVATVGGLGASSCCLVQLALNYVSVGCAGFAALDRQRPYWGLATVAVLGWRARRSPALAPWAVAAALAAIPALLRRWNLGGPAPAPDDVVFSVAGMKCEGCAAGLRQAVLDRLGASSAGRVSVDFERAQITVGGVQREVASAAIGAAAAERDYDVASEAGV